jgi:hypothetical protein
MGGRWLVAFGVLAGCATAGRPAARGPLEGEGGRVVAHAGVLPSGTRLVARLEHGLSTRRSQEGDPFVAAVSTPILDEQGRTWPTGCVHIEGDVARAIEGNAERAPQLRLGVHWWVAGTDAQPLRGRVISTGVLVTEEDRVPDRSARSGALAGAWLGPLFLTAPGAISIVPGTMGAYFGAVSGYSLGKRPPRLDATLPEGAYVTIELDRALVIGRPRGCPRGPASAVPS